MSETEAVRPRAWRGAVTSERLAFWVFVVALIGAVPLIVYANRDQWFFLDEWDFLAGRHLSIDSLLRPHNEHWTTVPIIGYRVLWRFVGLRHYWPYQAMAIAAHLAAAAMVRAVMRRAGVDAWLATAAAILLAVFGTGRDDIAWGFQITFTGSLAFGFAHLLCADHDGPFGRRDLLGLGCGLAALMCSGIGVTMVAVVGVATLLRRGWRMALLQVGPLAVVFLAWTARYGASSGTPVGSASAMARLFVNNLTRTLGAMGIYPGVGVLLAVVLVSGAALIVHGGVDAELRRRTAPVVGLLAGSVLFSANAAYGRAALSLEPAGRYLHLLAAMLLPAIALAASAVSDRWPRVMPVLAALFLVGIPVNVERLQPRGATRFTLGSASQMRTYAEVASELQPPRRARPIPLFAPAITNGWLIDGHRSGRIPALSRLDPGSRRTAELAFALDQVPTSGRRRCVFASATGPVHLRVGQRVRVDDQSVSISQLRDGALVGPIVYATSADVARFDRTRVVLEAVRSVDVLIQPQNRKPHTVRVCG